LRTRRPAPGTSWGQETRDRVTVHGDRLVLTLSPARFQPGSLLASSESARGGRRASAASATLSSIPGPEVELNDHHHPRMIVGREYNFRTGHEGGRQHCRAARPPLVDAGSLHYQEPAAASQPWSLSRSPRLGFRRMRNTNGRKTASITRPTTRIAAYLVDPSANPLLRLHAVAGILGEYSVFPAVDATKCKDVPLRLSCLHRKTPVGVGPGAFDCTIR